MERFIPNYRSIAKLAYDGDKYNCNATAVCGADMVGNVLAPVIWPCRPHHLQHWRAAACEAGCGGKQYQAPARWCDHAGLRGCCERYLGRLPLPFLARRPLHVPLPFALCPWFFLCTHVFCCKWCSSRCSCASMMCSQVGWVGTDAAVFQ